MAYLPVFGIKEDFKRSWYPATIGHISKLINLKI